MLHPKGFIVGSMYLGLVRSPSERLNVLNSVGRKRLVAVVSNSGEFKSCQPVRLYRSSSDRDCCRCNTHRNLVPAFLLSCSVEKFGLPLPNMADCWFGDVKTRPAVTLYGFPLFIIFRTDFFRGQLINFQDSDYHNFSTAWIFASGLVDKLKNVKKLVFSCCLWKILPHLK